MQHQSSNRSSHDYGRSNRRTVRRKRSGFSPKAALRVSLLCGLVALGGVGINRLMAGFTQEPVVVAQAAQSDILEGEASLIDENIAIDDVMPDYTEDARVIDYLNIEDEVSPHEMLDDLQETEPSSDSSEGEASTDAGEAAPAKPAQDSGGSGVDNIPYWKTVNSDTVGWLKVPGTNINYAVVQGSYTNYYTEKGYDKKYSKQGVIWADSNCGFGDSLSANTVLYGHNWTNYSANPRIGSPSDTHFAQLTAFQHLSFAKDHQFIWFSTEGQEMKWQIFAAFYTDIDFLYIDSAGGQGVIDGAIARSEHNYDVPVSSSDKVLTLSTCTRRFGQSNRQRFVVMAKLVDSSASAATVTTNSNPVRPNV